MEKQANELQQNVVMQPHTNNQPQINSNYQPQMQGPQPTPCRNCGQLVIFEHQVVHQYTPTQNVGGVLTGGIFPFCCCCCGANVQPEEKHFYVCPNCKVPQ